MMMNYLAIFVAAVASFVLGAVWSIALGDKWLAAMGKTEAEIAAAKAGPMPVGAMILSFVAQLVMAGMMAGLVTHMGGPTVEVGVVTAILIWIGFVVTIIAVGNAFQGRKIAATIMDSLHWLVIMVAQGVVLGLFGP